MFKTQVQKDEVNKTVFYHSLTKILTWSRIAGVFPKRGRRAGRRAAGRPPGGPCTPEWRARLPSEPHTLQQSSNQERVRQSEKIIV